MGFYNCFEYVFTVGPFQRQKEVLSGDGHVLGIFTLGISESWVEEGFDVASEFLFAQAVENLWN